MGIYRDNPSRIVKIALELESPAFTCGHCQFMTCLSGRWSVEDGRLVFRADADPQPRRGPSLNSCCESYDIAEFTEIRTDTDQIITGEELTALRETASHAYDDITRETWK